MGSLKITNIKVDNQELLVKDSNVGGPLLLTDLDQDSLDTSNLMIDRTGGKCELNTFSDHDNLLENEHLSLNVEGLLTENVKQLDHFNFELNEAEPEQLICDLCSKSFQKLKSLIIHLAQHTGEHTCLECKKVTESKPM